MNIHAQRSSITSFSALAPICAVALFSSLALGCSLEAPDEVEEGEQTEEAESALASCNAPIGGHVSYINADDAWFGPGGGTNYVTVRVKANGVVQSYEWLDRSRSVFTPGICWNGYCSPPRSTWYISGDYAGFTEVSSEGSVRLPSGVTVTPTSCSAYGSTSGSGSTTVVGNGSDGRTYEIYLWNQYLG